MRLPAITIGILSAFMSFSGGSPTHFSSTNLQNATGGSLTLGNIKLSNEIVIGLNKANEQSDISTFVPAVETVVPSPERQPIFVEVMKGDSLSKLATVYNTTYKRLYDANAFIQDPGIINPGDKIRIPYEDEVIAERVLPAAKPIPASIVSATKSAPIQARSYTASAPAVAGGSVWDRLAACESGGNWTINTGNGYYGGLQFTLSTWRAVGGQDYPHENSREEQIYRAEILLARSGWSQWPACTLKLGLR
jgi:LysM repeat protein